MAKSKTSQGSHSNDKRGAERSDIVLLCNPRAGGRWKELAEILDAEEARHVHRIVTDEVADIGPALRQLGRSSALLIIYGGDGTIQRIIDRMSPTASDDLRLALIGGGTMNVTSRWCGMSRKPAENFREVVRAYRSGELLLKETSLLEVRQGEKVRRGFTFGMGPLVRLLDAYERTKKGRLEAVKLGLRAMAAALTGRPAALAKLTEPMNAEVSLDGEQLTASRFTAVFANVTGQINPGVEPFTEARQRDSFHCAAYSVSSREFALALPLLMRGLIPLDVRALFRPSALAHMLGELMTARRLEIERDPRYINRSVRQLTVRSDESTYTIDGEILRVAPDEPLQLTLGPTLRLAVGPVAALQPAVKQAVSRAVHRVTPL